MRFRIAVAVVLLAASVRSQAGVNERTVGTGRWTTSGPYGPGGTILSLAIEPGSPSVAYAGTRLGGIFKTTDGARWSAINNGLTRLTVFALAIDPYASATVYALPEGGGVFKSTDGGAVWRPSSEGLTTLFLRTIAVDPVVPSTIYAGGHLGTVFKSSDGGSTWTPTLSLTVGTISALAIDPVSHLTVYAGTSAGVYRSVDGGVNWTPMNVGLGSSTPSVSHLVADSNLPRTLYAVTTGRLFRSTDAALTWQSVAAYPGSHISALAVAQDSRVIYAGNVDGQILKSVDYGSSWQPLSIPGAGTSPTESQTIGAIAARDPSSVYAGIGERGVVSSKNEGIDWLWQSAFRPMNISAVAVDPRSPQTVYAAAYSTNDGFFGEGSLFKSIDGGTSWQPINAGLSDPLSLRVRDLAIDPASPSTVYSASEAGLFRTIDGGQNWARVNEQGPPIRLWSIAIDPTAPWTLYAGGVGFVEKSFNSGQTWWPVLVTGNNAGIFTVAVDPSAPAHVVVGTTRGAYESRNAGGTWTSLDDGLPDWRIAALAISPRQPTVIHAGAIYWNSLPVGVQRPGGLFRSKGGLWKRVGQGLPEVGIRALTVDARAPARMFAGFWGRGVFGSNDHGATWVSLEGNGLPDHLFVNDLAFRADSRTLYAAAEGGVYQITFSAD
jgi:photosystem II stability/assembly factor-like uncharacterized protein